MPRQMPRQYYNGLFPLFIVIELCCKEIIILKRSNDETFFAMRVFTNSLIRM